MFFKIQHTREPGGTLEKTRVPEPDLSAVKNDSSFPENLGSQSWAWGVGSRAGYRLKVMAVELEASLEKIQDAQFTQGCLDGGPGPNGVLEGPGGWQPHTTPPDVPWMMDFLAARGPGEGHSPPPGRHPCRAQRGLAWRPGVPGETVVRGEEDFPTYTHLLWGTNAAHREFSLSPMNPAVPYYR